MLLISRLRIQRICEEIALGFAWVSLVPSWKAGVLLAFLTLAEPVIGLIGLIGALSAWSAGNVAGADVSERPVCVFNGLLTGLFIGHVWTATLQVAALALLGGIFSGWLAVVLGRLAWSAIRLPILSLPFAIVAMLTSAAGNSLSALRFNEYVAPPELFGTQLDKFLSAFGTLYFMPNPFAGIVVLSVLLVFSRYYVVIALLGYVSALTWLRLMGAAPEHLATTAWDSNAILAALLVGGLFSRPSLLTAALATLAAIIACWIALALSRILDVAHLVPFSAPFVLASWIVLYAAVRNVSMASSFNIGHPDFPERSHERAELSYARIGDPSSTSLALPYLGSWTVSQGFSGPHTHRGSWRHALDFIVIKDGVSFAGKGNRLEDFHCYGLPALSPAYGQVWRTQNQVADNKPGTTNLADNWGNYVLIRLQNGKFALVAHLKPGTVNVAPGAWVKPGDIIGACGNSGRSPQPHIHLHLQAAEEIGSPTVPFHVASVLVSENVEPAQYYLSVVPKERSTLVAAIEGNVRPIQLLAGRGLRYTVSSNEEVTVDWCLHCEVDELGRLILLSSRGGRCVAESTWAVFSCYERDSTSDLFLDLWLLGCGFTPASYHVSRWVDPRVLARMMPQTYARWAARLGWPWATFAEGGYERYWNDEAQAWFQRGSLRQKLTGVALSIEARLVPQLGCTYLSCHVGNVTYTMQATSYFQRADVGIPAWETPLTQTSFKAPSN